MRRFDNGIPITSFERTPAGGLRLKANLTSSGVFAYKTADGSTRLEYRPPEEVFAAAALASFVGAPVTDMHPDDFVTPENFSRLSKGTVLSVGAEAP